MHHPTDRILHTMTFVTPVMEHWLEWLYDVRHMAKDNLDNERGNQLPLLLAIHFKGTFICTNLQPGYYIPCMTFDTPDAIPAQHQNVTKALTNSILTCSS